MGEKDIEYGFDENDAEELMDSFYAAMYEIDQRKDYEIQGAISLTASELKGE